MDISLDSMNDSFESSDVVLTPTSKAAARQKRSFQKSYVCPHCSKKYMRKHSYQEHLAHHAGKTYNCLECHRKGLTELGLHMHIKFVHGGKAKGEKAANNNNELPAIDGFKIFESKEPSDDITYEFPQPELPLSPYSDDCSNFSVESAVSSYSSSSYFETFNYPDESTSSTIYSTASESSAASDVGPTDFEEVTHDDDGEDILKILTNKMEKNYIDVVLSFSEY